MEIEWFGRSDHSQWQPFCMVWESLKSRPLIAWVMDISRFNLASISSLLHHLHWEQYCQGTGERRAFFNQFPVSVSFQWFKVMTRLHLRLVISDNPTHCRFRTLSVNSPLLVLFIRTSFPPWGQMFLNVYSSRSSSASILNLFGTGWLQTVLGVYFFFFLYSSTTEFSAFEPFMM